MELSENAKDIFDNVIAIEIKKRYTNFNKTTVACGERYFTEGYGCNDPAISLQILKKLIDNSMYPNFFVESNFLLGYHVHRMESELTDAEIKHQIESIIDKKRF